MINILFFFLLVLACIAVMVYIRRTIQEMNDADLYDDEDLEDPWDL